MHSAGRPVKIQAFASEVVVGFDVRHPSLPPYERPISLLGLHSPRRSVDDLVWPIPTIPFKWSPNVGPPWLRDLFPEDVGSFQYLWADLDRFRVWLDLYRFYLQPEWNLVAITICTPRYWVANDGLVHEMDFKPAQTPFSEDWPLLGYDVGDWALNSYLFTNEATEEELHSVSVVSQEDKLANGLLGTRISALNFALEYEESAAPTEPPVVYGLYEVDTLHSL